MSKVDSSKKGGCPFLSNTISATFAYSIPALFHDGDSRPIVLFDDSHGDIHDHHRDHLYRNKLIKTLLKHDSRQDDPRGNLRFASFQSKVGRLLLNRLGDDVYKNKFAISNNNGNDNTAATAPDSIVICTPSKTYMDSSALLYLIHSLGGIKWKIVNYLSFLGYVVPTNMRDRLYAKFLEKRRKRKSKRKPSSLLELKGRRRKERKEKQRQLWMERMNERFINDAILTGEDDSIGTSAMGTEMATTHSMALSPLFDSNNDNKDNPRPPKRGDRVKVVWPMENNSQNGNGKAKEPTITYDDEEFPNGICLIGATGTISTIDLPMRVVLRVDRTSIGLENKKKKMMKMMTKEHGKEEDEVEEIVDTVIAWVKPEELVMA